MKKIVKNINNKRLKESCVLGLILVVVMGFVLVFTYGGEPENQYSGIIRLHVIANSDSPADQALKLKVRDKILTETKGLSSSQSVKASRQYLQAHLRDMEDAANRVIAENGEDYSARADLGVRWIPARTYGDLYFPAGNYEALNVTLGNGAGHNWWCVLFPPLCLIGEDEEPGAETLPGEQLGGEQPIELRSKLLEILQGE